VTVVDAEDDHRAVVTNHAADAIRHVATLEERLRLVDHSRISSVKVKAQPLGALEQADVPVAQVETEQLRVVGRGEAHRRRSRPAPET
jgi:hypothetical protein